MKFEKVEINTSRWFDLKPLACEIFKDIKGYEGRYQVSNYGRIKRLKRTYKQSRGYRTVEERILKCCIKPDNYLRVSFRCKNKINYLSIHRLVGETFLKNNENKPTINHIDGNKQNNRIDNLEWNTYKENNNHAFNNHLINTSKPVICLETKEVFKSVNNANRDKRFKANITNCCKDQNRTSNGYHFMFLEQYENIK